jgi:multidrug efflux pump
VNISAPFIRRPIGTILLSIGLFLAGMLAYFNLPVASLPNVERPTIRVSANLPGADPETVAATVAAPLERQLGTIAGVTELTSTSQTGSTSISIQFDVSRNIDDAARDVQAAINQAQADLPGTLSRRPTVRKSNSAASPVMILAMTSPVRKPTDLYDLADLVVSTRISQIEGVAEVTVQGAQKSAIRVVANPAELKARGLSMDDVRVALVQGNALVPVGTIEGSDKALTITVNGQLSNPADYANVVVKVKDGTVVRVGDIAEVSQGTSNRLNSGYFNKQPAVTLNVLKTADANVVATVDRITALLPELRRLVPADVEITVVNDRTKTIRASIHDLEITLALSIGLVMGVVLVFLRRTVPTMAAGLAVPLSLAGTIALMWVSGYSLNNMSLLAVTISTGFVVDDAIVVIENCYRNMEAGLKPFQAALEGSRQIGFTIVSISISLVAAFTPLLFMGGSIGRLIQEFAWTLTYAVLISALVSLTLTPMICGRFIRRLPKPREKWIDRRIEPFLDAILAGYKRSLGFALDHRALMLLITATTLALTVQLYISLPKGLVPQGDTGLLIGFIRASPQSSFDTLDRLMKQATEILIKDPDAAGLATAAGGDAGFGANSSTGRFFLSLRPQPERQTPILGVVARLRQELSVLKGVDITMFPAQEIQFGARGGRAQYQVTISSQEIRDIVEWLPKVVAAVRQVPGVTDVSSDREVGAPQAYLTIDRVKAAKFGVAARDIDSALNNAFSQRPVSTFYDFRNQYSVILEADLSIQRSLDGLQSVFVKGSGGQQVPLSAIATLSMTSAPLAINHTGVFPSATISFNTDQNTTLGEVLPRVLAVAQALKMPDTVRLELGGETLALTRQQSDEPLLILAALLAVYLILGILYEDLVHPLTILSTLPSAGFGALITLQATGNGLSIIALIGIILLIGVVKKNGIMLVDFALDAERTHGLPPKEAIRLACIERFRPILMTTLAAMFGAIPLLLATGPGSELRTPLGLTIVGGLAVSQVLTIYTTPVIYLLLDPLRGRTRRRATSQAAVPAE